MNCRQCDDFRKQLDTIIEESEINDEVISKKIGTLESQNKKLKEVLRFYADPESWIKRKGEAWNKSSPVEKGDDEMIRNYKHPEKDWVGTVVVGGKLAREVLKEIEND